MGPGSNHDVVRTLRSLRAARTFRPDPVPDAVLEEVLDAARWTGSARNRQPWRVAPITDPRARAELATLGRYSAHLAEAPLVLLLAVDHELGGADAEFDAGRFAQTLMLAAHAHGLGSCPVSFFPEENVRVATRRAGLSEPWRVRTAIAIGYPARQSPMPGARSAIPTGRHSVAAITLSVAIAFGVGAVLPHGSESSPSSAADSVVRVANAARAAVLADRPREVCRLLTHRAQRNARLYSNYADARDRVKHPGANTCEAAVAFQIDEARGYASGYREIRRTPTRAAFTVLRVRGKRAHVRLVITLRSGRTEADVYFLKGPRGWRIDFSNFAPFDGSSGR